MPMFIGALKLALIIWIVGFWCNCLLDKCLLHIFTVLAVVNVEYVQWLLLLMLNIYTMVVVNVEYTWFSKNKGIHLVVVDLWVGSMYCVVSATNWSHISSLLSDLLMFRPLYKFWDACGLLVGDTLFNSICITDEGNFGQLHVFPG